MCMQVVEGVWACQHSVGDVPNYQPRTPPDPLTPFFHAAHTPLWRTYGLNTRKFQTTGPLVVGTVAPAATAARRAAAVAAVEAKKAVAELASLRGMFTMQLQVRALSATSCTAL